MVLRFMNAYSIHLKYRQECRRAQMIISGMFASIAIWLSFVVPG